MIYSLNTRVVFTVNSQHETSNSAARFRAGSSYECDSVLLRMRMKNIKVKRFMKMVIKLLHTF